METMRALVYDRPSVCSVRDVPMPVCGEDEVVIKVMAASICKGADRRHHTTGHKLGRYPITTGHEFAGYIYQVGSAVTGWNVGDRVTCLLYTGRMCWFAEPARTASFWHSCSNTPTQTM